MNKELQNSQVCVWCGKSAKTNDDHVFPRALGATKQLKVPDCETCRKDISAIEGKVAHCTEFALYRFEKGPPPRNPKRPESGSVGAVYIFVKDEQHGGYAEIALRSKQDPITLPSIEVDVNTGKARCNGTKPEDVDKLRDAVLRVISGQPDAQGMVGEINGNLLTEEDSHIASDPDWWPRIFLDIRGHLKIRARDGNEAERFFSKLSDLLQKGAFRDHSQWRNGVVPAGTPHYAKLRYDGLSIFRVVSKIAYALAHHQVLPERLDSEALRKLSLFVRGKEPQGYNPPVQSVSGPKSFTEYPNHHLAMIESDEGMLWGTVILYGACYLVELGIVPRHGTFLKPIIAMSRRDGTSTFLVKDESVEGMYKAIKRHLKS